MKHSVLLEVWRTGGQASGRIEYTTILCVGEEMEGFLYLALGAQFHWEASQFKYIWETSRATQPMTNFVTSCAL